MWVSWLISLAQSQSPRSGDRVSKNQCGQLLRNNTWPPHAHTHLYTQEGQTEADTHRDSLTYLPAQAQAFTSALADHHNTLGSKDILSPILKSENQEDQQVSRQLETMKLTEISLVCSFPHFPADTPVL